MGHLGRLTSTPYLVLFVIIITIGISAAYAVTSVTFESDVMVDGDLDVSDQITGPTITNLDNRITALEGG